ncbi:MAG: histidine--tRNA ligase, partial [Pseudomonadota bacterium]
ARTTTIIGNDDQFTKAVGQSTDVVEKEMYALNDRNDESLCLRPEGTAGVVRAVLQHGLLNPPGLKTWYRGPMFRYERPQKGRQRQFYQVGAEVFGMADPIADAELIAMVHRIWHALEIAQHVTLEINSLGDKQDRAEYRVALQEYLRPFQAELDADSQRRLETNPLRIFDSKSASTQAIMKNAPLLTEYLGQDARQHFEQVCLLLDQLGIAYRVNPGLVRGIDYYGRSVFEWKTDRLGAQGTICAGGRYNDLVEMQGGKPTPGIGFALGMERLLELVQKTERSYARPPDAYLVSTLTNGEPLVLAEQLRSDWPELKLHVDLIGGSFKAQFRRADRSGAEWALVLAEDELASGRIAVKHLRGKKAQQSIQRKALADWLKLNSVQA